MLFNYKNEKKRKMGYSDSYAYFNYLRISEFEKFLLLFENFGTTEFKFRHEEFKETYSKSTSIINLILLINRTFKLFNIKEKFSLGSVQFALLRLEFSVATIQKYYNEDINHGISILIFCSKFLEKIESEQKKEFDQKAFNLLKNIELETKKEEAIKW